MASSDRPASVTFALAPERMPAIPADQMSAAQKEAAAEIAAGPRGKVVGPFIPLMRSPEFMRRVQKVGEYVRFVCPLDPRLNEFAAIIAARYWNQQFVWSAHAPKAINAGLHQDVADAVGEGRRPVDMADDEEIVYDLLTEVFNTRGASDRTYARAVEKFGEAGLVDLLGIAGYYSMLGMIMNVARTAVPAGPPLPLASLPVRTYQT